MPLAQVDALVVLSAAPSATDAGCRHHHHHDHHHQQEVADAADTADRPGAVPACSPWHYVIRMNHTDVPPTPLLLDLFDVAPTRNNGLGLYRDYWFFTNLQVRG